MYIIVRNSLCQIKYKKYPNIAIKKYNIVIDMFQQINIMNV